MSKQQTNKFLLFEDVDTSSIEMVIKKRKPVKVYYSADDDPKGSGWRVIQPVCYGLSKAGNPVIRAWQPFGDTKTKVPHWKLFRVDRFTAWKPIMKKTNLQEPPLEDYNPNGDKTMSVVYINADFEGAKRHYQGSGLERYNIARHAEKVAQNPYYDLQKNIERAKRLGSPDYVQKNVSDWDKNKPKDMVKYLNGASAEEMARTTDFGDNTYSQTDAPVTKGTENQAVNPPTSKISNQKKQQTYQNVALNGPVNKGTENLKDTNDTNSTRGETNRTPRTQPVPKRTDVPSDEEEKEQEKSEL